MSNPVLVEVTRGALTESRHCGAVAVCDADGGTVLSIGDIDRPVFPRSAVKAFQALPLVESGAADAFGFGDAELALACASHSGEARHVETARAMLAASGLGEGSLECGSHVPRRETDVAALALRGETPGPAYNNCSGKHSAMLATCRHCGWTVRGYSRREHEMQHLVAATIGKLCLHPVSDEMSGTDGCSLPTWALPLKALARGFARFGSGIGLSESHAKAAQRLRKAVAAEPFMVAGTGRFCTRAMDIFGARAFVKTGAEGVFCAALPEQGLGIALKCDDGTTRAAETMMAALLARFVPLSRDEEAMLEPLLRPRIVNWNGMHVGGIRPSGPLAT